MITATATSLRMRREAARRLPPLECGHADPLDCASESVGGPVPFEPFGLSEEQRRRHGTDLVVEFGWSLDEVEQVLRIRPRAVA